MLRIKKWLWARAPAIMSSLGATRRALLGVRWVVAPNIDQQSRTKPRLLIEVTQTSQMRLLTGIQRVVLRLTRELLHKTDPAFEIVCVRLEEVGITVRMVRALEFERRLEAPTVASDASITFRPNDTLLLLDSSWRELLQLKRMFSRLRSVNGRVVSCVYDLIPATHPEYCIDPLVRDFRRWLRTMLRNTDSIVCISQASADELRAYINRRRRPFQGPVRWFHLGADFALTQAPAVTKAGIPTILIVGTIEPRKGHVIALDALDRLWAEGRKVKLHIVGGHGWKTEQLISRIENHPLSGSLLALSRSTDDDGLLRAYAEADLVLSPSFVEGFGLPLVEGAALGKPLMVSDIPVYREVCKEGAIYFKPGDVDDLAAKLRSWLDNRHTPPPPAILSWSESADQLITLLISEQAGQTVTPQVSRKPSSERTQSVK
jgi:glycosyltransferase involved in cell wall biosynthesis